MNTTPITEALKDAILLLERNASGLGGDTELYNRWMKSATTLKKLMNEQESADAAKARTRIMPLALRDVNEWMRSMFLLSGASEIRMTAEDIKREVFHHVDYDMNYLRGVLRDDLGVQTVRNAKGDGPGTCAYSYYRFTKQWNSCFETPQDIEEVKVPMPARPFVFPRAMFF